MWLLMGVIQLRWSSRKKKNKFKLKLIVTDFNLWYSKDKNKEKTTKFKTTYYKWKIIKYTI
jgi:hypothetical protein